MADKLECPYNIPADQCCKEKNCQVWKERLKTTKGKKRELCLTK